MLLPYDVGGDELLAAQAHAHGGGGGGGEGEGKAEDGAQESKDGDSKEGGGGGGGGGGGEDEDEGAEKGEGEDGEEREGGEGGEGSPRAAEGDGAGGDDDEAKAAAAAKKKKAKAPVDKFAGLKIEHDGEHLLDLPPSWSAPLRVDRAALRAALDPRFGVTQLGFKSRLEQFGVHAHPFGLVSRLTTFSDAERLFATRVVEAFQRRRDGLFKRVRRAPAGAAR